jgi:methylglyoxal synthase
MELITRTISESKNIALAAHERRKDALIQWTVINKALLSQHTLYATHTTGHLIQRSTGITVNTMLSGPMGGDQQLGARIAQGEIDVLIFFWDPLGAIPHSSDVKALLRLATVWNIPIATNETTANFLIQSPLFSQKITISISTDVLSFPA